MEKKGRKVKKEIFSPKCDKHPKYTLDLFCVDCNKLFCVICQATEHKSGDHAKIQTIEEASTDCAEIKEFLEYEDKLNTVYTRGNETLAEINELNLMTDQLKKEAESLIKKHKQDFIDLIEKHHKNLYESNKLQYEQSKKRLHGVNKQLCKNKNKTAGIRQVINAKKESGQSVALFIAMKKSQDNLRQIEIELEEIEKSNFFERYKCQAGQMVGQLLEEEKKIDDFFVMVTKSPKVSPRELKPRAVFELPRQSIDTRQAEVADEDEEDDYLLPREFKPRGVFELPRQSYYIRQAEVVDEDEQDDYLWPRELKPRGVFELPRQSIDTRQAEVVDEDEQDDYEPVGQYAGNGSENDQITPQEHSTCRDSTQSLNCLFTEETNKLKRFSGDIFKYPSTEYMDSDAEDEQVDTRMPHNAAASRDFDIFSDDLNKRSGALPIANKSWPGTIQRRRNMWHQSTDMVQPREIEQTQKPGSPIPSTEREQAAHPDPLFHSQSCQDMIQVPKQKPEKYIAKWDFKPRTQNEIELKKGNVVTVLEKCNQDWFLAEASERQGYIPVSYVRKAENNYGRKNEDNYVKKAEDIYVRKAEDKKDKKNPGGDLTNELETVLRCRRAMSEKSSSAEE